MLVSINKAPFFIDNLMSTTFQRDSMLIPVKNYKIFNITLGYHEMYNDHYWKRLK